MMNMPTREEAERLLCWAAKLNPGPWEGHSKTVARAAQTIAESCGMDAEKAYVMGLLHDIGRYEGVRALHHVLVGYELLKEKGYDACARICMTHSFPLKNIDEFTGPKDCTKEEIQTISDYLAAVQYDDYDRLIQLCDAISLPSGVALMDTRLMDVGMRAGFYDLTIPKWKAFYETKRYFDQKCRLNLYNLFREEIIRGIFEE